jgi:hypothetical protein
VRRGVSERWSSTRWAPAARTSWRWLTQLYSIYLLAGHVGMRPVAARRPVGPVKECLGTAHQCRAHEDPCRHTLCRHRGPRVPVRSGCHVNNWAQTAPRRCEAHDELRRSSEPARRLPGAGGRGITSGLPVCAQVVGRRAGRDDPGRPRAGAYSTSSQHVPAFCELPWAVHPRCHVPCSTQPAQVAAHMASFTAAASSDDAQKAQLLRAALEHVSYGIQDALGGMPARGGAAHQMGPPPSTDGQAHSPAPHSELHAAR